MILEQLLGEKPIAGFIAGHYLRLPLAMSGGSAPFASLGSWATVETVLAARCPDVLVSRAGNMWDGGTPTSYTEARELHRAGYTITLRHAEKHHAGLARLAAGFEQDFHAPVNIHLYCTPAHQHGFGWHYDAEEVFILQTAGSKEYFLRKNTVHPWPLVETIPTNMAYPREIMPMMDCTLKAGDWLYIPSGYWHRARAPEESISLSVGLMAPSGIDVYDFLRPRLLDSLRWRQRLPVSGQAGQLTHGSLVTQYAALVRVLVEDLAKIMADETIVRAFLAETEKRYSTGDQASTISADRPPVPNGNEAPRCTMSKDEGQVSQE